MKITFTWSINGRYYFDRNELQPLEGLRIIVHNSDEFPRSGDQIFFVNYNEVIDAFASVEMSMIDDNLKKWKPEKRNCYLNGERNLKYFKKYTKNNCIDECRSEKMFKACDCVPFHMIRKLI